MQNFTHHKHPLTVYDEANNTRYLCESCMISGSGKRFHCHQCNFNLHEYCRTCPMILSSFMHNHPLNLVGANQIKRICKVCRDPIEGLSYRCEFCNFDVHPICTRLPETIRHALHQEHPLSLQGSSVSGNCAVCRGPCNAYSWRYRCAICSFDIHLDCVLIQCEKKTTHRGISTYFPPSAFPQQHYFNGYAYGISTPYLNPSPYPYPGPSYMQHYYMPQPQLQLQPQPHPLSHPQPHPQPQHHSHGQANQTHYGGGRIGKVMFDLVQALAIGAFSNAIFGVDASPFLGA